MNHALIGTSTTILDHIDPWSDFLLIDDGPLIDALELPARRSVTHFDVSKDGLQPLYRADDIRVKEILAIFDATFRGGPSTLTRENANFALFDAILNGGLRRLDRFTDNPKDAGVHYMYQKIQYLLASPILRSVLCTARQTKLKKVVLARLDRATIGDETAFIIASFLTIAFKGQVIIPDLPFYGRDFHVKLIREDRLTGGVDQLRRLKSDDLRDGFLTIPQKTLRGVRYADAVLLANDMGYQPDPLRQDNQYNQFLADIMGTRGFSTDGSAV